MTNEEFDAIMEGTVKELATQQSWLDKQKDNVDHIYKLLRGLKELEGQLRREREERVLERDVLEKKLADARAAAQRVVESRYQLPPGIDDAMEGLEKALERMRP